MNATSSAGSHDGRPNLAAVRDYYEQTWFDYRLLWLRPRDRAIHFGFWEADTRSHAQSLLNMNRALATRLGVTSGARVLDAGCGVGGSSLWLAKTFDASVVGITPVPSQITRARHYAEQQGLADHVTFELEDYTATAFPDHSFDFIWAMESVCHAPDKRLFLAEARRLLRPGGRLGMVEYLRTARPLADGDEALLHSWLSGWAIPDLGTADEFQQWMGETGFEQVTIEDIGARVYPSLQRLYRYAQVFWPFADLLFRARLRSATAQGNIRGARDQFRALRRGLWHESIMTATAGAI